MKVFPLFFMLDPDKPQSNKPKPSKVPFLMRTQAMGSSGWEAYTVGFTLVGCILGGAGLGWLLDSHFKTNYWLPILFLVGVVGGFREMWVVLKRVQAQDEQKRREKIASIPLAPTPTRRPDVEPQSAPERKRIFQVPPPPTEESSAAPQVARNEESVDDIMKRLLAEADDNLTSDDPSEKK